MRRLAAVTPDRTPVPTIGSAARLLALPDLRTRWLVARLARCRSAAREDELRRELAHSNGRLAETIARRYLHRGVGLDALKCVAHRGMIKAASRFDPAAEPDFASYAASVVRAELRRLFHDEATRVDGDREPAGPQIADASRLLRRAAPCLAAQDRRILELRYLEGRSEAEIGALLGMSTPQVVRGIRRVLLQLRLAEGTSGPLLLRVETTPDGGPR